MQLHDGPQPPKRESLSTKNGSWNDEETRSLQRRYAERFRQESSRAMQNLTVSIVRDSLSLFPRLRNPHFLHVAILYPLWIETCIVESAFGHAGTSQVLQA